LTKIGIPKPDNWFDYVHQRFLVAAIPKDGWQKHINESVRICAPGGWIEFIESDGIVIDGGPGTQQFNTWLIQGLAARGVDITVVDRLDVPMRKAGLVNVTTQSYIMPVGDWGNQAGLLFAEVFRMFVESIEPLFIDVLRIPREQVETVVALALEEFKYTRSHTKFYVHLGQKAAI
jgi:hypothetical protein